MLGKQILCTAIPALCLTIVSAIAYLGGYRLNTTASLPAGIWKITDHYARGSYVSACIPPEAPMMAYAIKHAYLPDGICPGGFAPLLKKIAAAPGDTVRLTVDSMTVNGLYEANTYGTEIGYEGGIVEEKGVESGR